MQQRQPRLGDILDDYCPRERRLTNHAVVAMIGADIRQTRCTTCDAEHEYKHAKVPRQRRKGEERAALYSQVLTGGPKRVPHEQSLPAVDEIEAPEMRPAAPPAEMRAPAALSPEPPQIPEEIDPTDLIEPEATEEGPVHRPLIRATLPRHEGQVPPARPAPDFTIRQPGGGRPNRFRPRNQRGGQMFQGNRASGAAGGGRGPARPNGRPPQGVMTPRSPRRHDAGRKRSK